MKSIIEIFDEWRENPMPDINWPEIPIRRTWQDIRDKLKDTGEVTVVFGTGLFYSGMKRNGDQNDIERSAPRRPGS